MPLDPWVTQWTGSSWVIEYVLAAYCRNEEAMIRRGPLSGQGRKAQRSSEERWPSTTAGKKTVLCVSAMRAGGSGGLGLAQCKEDGG